MKYLKIYETINQIKISDKSTWVIYGNPKTQCDVISKLSLNLKDPDLKKDLKIVKYLIKTDEELYNTIGTILSFNYDNDLFKYYSFDDEKDKNYIIYSTYKNYTLKGELKIINNKIVLDMKLIQINIIYEIY